MNMHKRLTTLKETTKSTIYDRIFTILTNEQQRFALGPFGPVRQRPGHRQIPVETDQQQVEHGSVAGQVVKRQPAVAHVPAEGPVSQYRVHGEQWHGYETDEEVGQREAEQEVIADVLQLLVDLERHHDHNVAGHGDEAEHAGHESDEHRLGQREPGRHAAGTAATVSAADGFDGRRRRRRHRCPRIAARRFGR